MTCLVCVGVEGLGVIATVGVGGSVVFEVSDVLLVKTVLVGEDCVVVVGVDILVGV